MARHAPKTWQDYVCLQETVSSLKAFQSLQPSDAFCEAEDSDRVVYSGLARAYKAGVSNEVLKAFITSLGANGVNRARLNFEGQLALRQAATDAHGRASQLHCGQLHCSAALTFLSAVTKLVWTSLQTAHCSASCMATAALAPAPAATHAQLLDSTTCCKKVRSCTLCVR